jgi:hypothetical protein
MRWPDVSWGRGAASPPGRPRNTVPRLSATHWTRTSSRSSARVHSMHGRAHSSPPSAPGRQTDIHDPALRRTHRPTWCRAAPWRLAAASQAAIRRRSAQQRWLLRTASGGWASRGGPFALGFTVTGLHHRARDSVCAGGEGRGPAERCVNVLHAGRPCTHGMSFLYDSVNAPDVVPRSIGPSVPLGPTVFRSHGPSGARSAPLLRGGRRNAPMSCPGA